MSEANAYDLNLDTVEKLKDRAPRKPGPAVVTVKALEGGESMQKKTPYIEVDFEYTDAGVSTVDGKETQQTISRSYYIGQKSLPFIRNLVEGLGLNWDEFKPTLGVVFEPLKTKDINEFKNRVTQHLSGLINMSGTATIELEAYTKDNTTRYRNQVGKFIVAGQ